MTTPVWLFTNLPPPIHGVSVFNSMFLGELVARNVPHRVFRIGTRGALSGVEKFSLSKVMSDARSLIELRAALRAARTQNPVVYFTPSLSGAAVLRDFAITQLCRAYSVPVVAHIHNGAWVDTWQAHQNTVSGRLMLRALQACSRVICLGATLATKMRSTTGIAAVGINNGVEIDLVAARREENGCLELLFLSNLQREKGLFTAATTARSLADQGIRVRLRCAGSWRSSGDEAAFRDEYARELRDGTIALVGFADADAKSQLLSTSHFLLLPSELLEGQPLSIIEAMAAGVVPITTRGGGIQDLFGFRGWQALATNDHKDPKQVAATVAAIWRDKARLAQLVEECRERFRSGLTFSRCVDEVLTVIEEAAA